jgi:hypothetical protein
LQREFSKHLFSNHVQFWAHAACLDPHLINLTREIQIEIMFFKLEPTGTVNKEQSCLQKEFLKQAQI